MKNYRIIKNIDDGKRVFSLCEEGELSGNERSYYEILCGDSVFSLYAQAQNLMGAFNQAVIDETLRGTKSPAKYPTLRQDTFNG